MESSAEPMTPLTALDRLRAMLDVAGFDPDAPRLSVAWDVVRAWIALPVEGMDPDEDADMVSYETIRPRARGDGEPPRFNLSFTRQFMHYKDGEYSGMEQLFLDLSYSADALGGVRETQFWGVPGRRSGLWAASVEADPGFVAALELAPLACEIAQSPV